MLDVPLFLANSISVLATSLHLSLRKQILHMMKHKYLPFTTGKQKYGKTMAPSTENESLLPYTNLENPSWMKRRRPFALTTEDFVCMGNDQDSAAEILFICWKVATDFVRSAWILKEIVNEVILLLITERCHLEFYVHNT